MLGFETIGNATITVFDGSPVLSTDPWIYGNPYFGSWGHKFSIPKQQIENIKKTKFIWLSHGHPDHIDPESFKIFKNKIILIPDHYGDRIFKDLSKNYNCIKIISNKWFKISKNVRIKSFADWNQDASILIEISKKNIIFNLNDGQALGWSQTIRKIISNYKNKFLLRLINWGDADMINFYNHHDQFIMPLASQKKPCGESYSYHLKKWNCNITLPFSSMHRYIREDSIKMNKYVTPLDQHYEKFNNKYGEMLPAFIRFDCEKNDFTKISVKENLFEIKKPIYFGDNWSDQLDQKDQKVIETYFNKFDHLKKNFGFLNFRIGKKDFNLKISNRKEGIKLEAPRNSLIFSIQNNIFDDILIGNFMKVQLINVPSLYPDFIPYVTKYGDNGGARSNRELKKYFDYYKMNSTSYWLDSLKLKSEDIIRAKLNDYRPLYFAARKLRRVLPY